MLYHLNLILQYFVSGIQAIHPIMLPTSSSRLVLLMHYLTFEIIYLYYYILISYL